ncbi:hypothetical protein ACFX1Z_024327 [Malus domestica]
METQWFLPPAHYVKINVDASQVASSSKGFVGLVARDSDGKFLAARSWMAYPILAKVKNFRDSFQDCCWSWTPRSADKEADLLASQKLKEMCNVLWVDRPSSFLVFVLNNDGLLCPH